MHLALIAPCSTSSASNAGAHMITAGIRWLLRRAVPGVRFSLVEMLRDAPDQWAAAAQTADAFVLCGNPRFSTSADAWWEDGIWQRIADAAAVRGARVIDAWGGACLALPEPGMVLDVPASARHLVGFRRIAERVGPRMRASGMRAIARDDVAQACYEALGVPSVRLPCSSWWAQREHGVQIRSWADDGRQNSIILLRLDGHEGAAEALRILPARIATLPGARGRDLPTRIIATCVQDYAWAREQGLDDVQLITDPPSLLRVYALSNVVVSLRIHASIPAASLGASVCTLAVDTRARICDPFGLPHQPLADLFNPDAPLRADFAVPPALEPVVAHLQEHLTA